LDTVGSGEGGDRLFTTFRQPQTWQGTDLPATGGKANLNILAWKDVWASLPALRQIN
jgi:hypothetical protein